MVIERKSELLNGVKVPYEADIDSLRSQLTPPGPQAWAACIALGNHPSDEAFELLVELANSPDWSYRRAAIEAIGLHKRGKSAAELLRSHLSDSSEYVVRTSCDTIAKLGLHELHDSILSLLDSQSPSTRETALRALSVLWQPSDFDKVFSIFAHDPSGEVRKESAWTLNANVSEDNWNKLFGAWKGDSLARYRIWACELAERFADAKLGDELEKLLADRDGHVRKAAHRALEKINP